jgi:S-adenosylmethionine decarboxylase
MPEVKTMELLVYGIKGDFKTDLEPGSKAQEKIKTEMQRIFSKYELDQFFFEPCGFSLNGLSGSRYVTIHITPQGDESYFSFEMDQFEVERDGVIIQDLLKLCKPSSFDLIYFSKTDEKVPLDLDDFQLKQKAKGTIQAGYNVTYSHYFDPEDVNEAPVIILGDEHV